MNKQWKLGLSITVFIFLVFFLPNILAATTQNLTPDYYYPVQVSSVNFLPTAIMPGDIVSMAVNVKNNGTIVGVMDLNAILDIGNDFFEPVFLSDNISSIAPGATQTIILKFRVKERTPPGYYPLFLTLNYNRLDLLGNTMPISQNKSISVGVSSGQKNLVLEVNPTSISPGKQSILNFRISNFSGIAVSNVLLTWGEKSGLVLPLGSDSRKLIPFLDAGEVIDVNYVVAADPNITTGIYSLNTELLYNDSNGTRMQNSQIGILIGGATNFQVSADTTNQGQLSFSIANIGSNNAGAVVVILPRQAGLSISGSNTVIIGSLNKGDYSIATFTATPIIDTNFGGQPTSNQSSFRRQAVTNNNSLEDTNTQIIQNPTTHLVQISYTDTTGARQLVEVPFTINQSRVFGATTNSNINTTTNIDTIQIALVLILGIVCGIAYNLFRAKKSWKRFVLITLMGAVVLTIIIIFIPRALITPILSGILLLCVIILGLEISPDKVEFRVKK